jgi:hypothetical protein
MDLKKVRPYARHRRWTESITILNTVEMKGRSEFPRGAATELGENESTRSRIEDEIGAPQASVVWQPKWHLSALALLVLMVYWGWDR